MESEIKLPEATVISFVILFGCRNMEITKGLILIVQSTGCFVKTPSKT